MTSSQPSIWAPEFETLSEQERRAVEAPLIARQIQYVYQHSEFYRTRMTDAGVADDEIADQQSLAALPLLEKSDITDAQREGALFGPHQCADFRDIVRVVATGGSSGQPTRLAWTRSDIELYNEMGARALWTMGCRPSEMVINCFNYSLYAGGVMDHMAFETLGAGVLAYGTSNSKRLMALLQSLPQSGDVEQFALYSTPSYALRLHELANEAGIALRDLPLRKGYFSGEPGLQMPGYRRSIEEAWNMQAMDLYGAAEVGVQSGECEHRSGLHYSGAGLVIAELIEPESGDVVEMSNGVEGEMVFTTLKRQACPLIRFRTHDVVRVQTGICECGRTSFRFHVLGRSDDMFIVKGVNVFPLAVHEAVLSLRPRTTGEFCIVLTESPPIDYSPIIYVELDSALSATDRDIVLSTLHAAVAQQCNFSAKLVPVAAGTIASEHKTQRLYRCYEGQQGPAFTTLQ